MCHYVGCCKWDIIDYVICYKWVIINYIICYKWGIIDYPHDICYILLDLCFPLVTCVNIEFNIIITNIIQLIILLNSIQTYFLIIFYKIMNI